MWSCFGLAIGLVLVLEGVLPFAIPDQYKSWLEKMSKISSKALRVTGFCSMLVGAIIIVVIHQVWTVG